MAARFFWKAWISDSESLERQLKEGEQL